MRTQEAVDHYGSQTELANAMGLTPQAIHKWGDYPPIARQYQIQVLTKGKLKAEKKEKVGH